MLEKTVTSTEFQARAGRYIDEAARLPVFITRHNRPVRVLIDVEEYQRLKALDTARASLTSEFPDDLREAVLTAEPIRYPPGTKVLPK